MPAEKLSFHFLAKANRQLSVDQFFNIFAKVILLLVRLLLERFDSGEGLEATGWAEKRIPSASLS